MPWRAVEGCIKIADATIAPEETIILDFNDAIQAKR